MIVELDRRSELFLRALAETGDAALSLEAADYALSLEPTPRRPPARASRAPEKKQTGAAFSLELFDKKAQAVLNRALEASKRLSAEAKRDLEKALAFEDAARVARAVLDWVERWRAPLASLLSCTQISSFLAGMREVMRAVPEYLQASGDGPLPPSLSPEEAAKLIARLRGLPVEERGRAIASEPIEHQVFLRSAMRQPPEPPSFSPPPIPPGDPGRVHLVTIDEAVKELSEKRVLTKDEYTRLDSASRQKAFTVAGVESRMTLEKVRDALAENVREGADLATFREKVLESVDEGTFLSPGHMETVFRTSVQQVFSDGQENVWKHPLIRGGFPFVVWHSIRDDRRRPEHGAMEHNGLDGTAVYRADDPTIRAWRPPADFGCRCGLTYISVEEAARRGVKHAQEWLAAGAEPPPVYVPYIPPPNPDFKREAPLLSLSLSALPLEISLGMVGDEWHGPQPPGEGWVRVGAGPKGGLIWRRKDARTTPKPPPLPYKSSQAKPLTGKSLEAAAAFKAALQQSAHLAPERKREYAAAIDHVLSRMPETAAAKLRANTKSVVFHADAGRSTDAALNLSAPEGRAKRQAMIEKGWRVIGFWEAPKQALNLDGQGIMHGPGDLGERTIHGGYAHEMAHAIDGPNYEFSDSPEWVAVWKEEIGDKPPPEGEHGRLTRYATTARWEGFAEFGRLLYSTDIDRDVIERRFPKCSAYWKSKGLWK